MTTHTFERGGVGGCHATTGSRAAAAGGISTVTGRRVAASCPVVTSTGWSPDAPETADARSGCWAGTGPGLVADPVDGTGDDDARERDGFGVDVTIESDTVST